MHGVLVVFAGLAVVELGLAARRGLQDLRREGGNKTEKVSEQRI
jgi:hypothetical protein